MNDDFNDRLLEESLKQYSRVSPPEGFEVRLPAEKAGISRWWLLLPAAAALATALLLLPRPAPAPQSPQTKPQTTAGIPQVIRVRIPHSGRRGDRIPQSRRFRVLTARELAQLDLSADLFAPPEERPLKDLEVPELEIKPLAGSEESGRPKE